MRLAAGFALLAAPLAVPSAAQELPDFITDLTPPAEAADDLQAEAPRELSELERLSRLEDDPFAGVLEREAREPVSVTLRALNKVTARYSDIEIAMNEIARFGSLELQPRTCDKRPPEEFPETTAFLEIFDTKAVGVSNWKREELNAPAAPAAQAGEGAAKADNYDPMLTAPQALPAGRFGPGPAPAADEPAADDLQAEFIAALEADLGRGAVLEGAPAAEGEAAGEAALEVLEGPQAQGENIFRGWMFASSPALNALEHPVYDVWVIDCKTRLASN